MCKQREDIWRQRSGNAQTTEKKETMMIKCNEMRTEGTLRPSAGMFPAHTEPTDHRMARSATDLANTHLGWSSVGNRSKHNGALPWSYGPRDHALCSHWKKCHLGHRSQILWRHKIPSGNQPSAMRISSYDLYLISYVLYLISYILCLINIFIILCLASCMHFSLKSFMHLGPAPWATPNL